jgi:phosphatidylglycerophosphatase A
VSIPDARRAFASHPFAALLATGLGSGLSPLAPGTAGSLVGLAIAWLLVQAISSLHPVDPSLACALGLLMSGLVVGLVGVAVSGPICRVLEAKDPGCIVIDEIAGQLIASSPVPLAVSARSRIPEAALWIASFLLFRLLDVWKPGPIRRLQDLPGGWGVVADDVGAGAAAAVVVAVALALR